MYCSKCGTQNKADANFCKSCGNKVGNGSPKIVAASERELALPASLLQRFLHHVVDSIAMYVFALAVGFIAYFLFGEIVAPILAYIAFFTYYLIFESLFQRTLGKVLTGTKVVDLQGEKPSFLAVLGRTLARYIPFEPISFLFYGAYPTKGWHDRLSRTLVVPKNLTPQEVQNIDPEKIRQQKHNNAAVTIIAIVVGVFFFIAIIGILSSVVLASLNSAREKSRDARRIADVKQLQLALELHFDSEGRYPSSLISLEAKYIPIVPTDPMDQGEYFYESLSQGSDYNLGTNLETRHSILEGDADRRSGGAIDADDSDGCSGEVGRHCYNEKP